MRGSVHDVVRFRRRGAVLAAGLAAVAIAASACSGGEVKKEELTALQAQVAALQSQVADFAETADAARQQAVNAMLTATLPNIGGTAFHAINEQIVMERVIPATAGGAALRARQALAQDFWPPELQGHVEAYLHEVEQFEAALEADDIDAAALASGRVHGYAHAFEGAIAAYLAGDAVPAPAEPGGDSGDADHDDETGDTAHDDSGSDDAE